ncbi:MAG: DUF58 domain-containing protein [bacterium]|nr:DUF58 domain-containing protein [bacterium]
MRFTPTPKMLLLLGPLACLALPADLRVLGQESLVLVLAAVATLALIDLLRLGRPLTLKVERRVRRSLPLNVWSPLGLTITNTARQAFSARCADRWPQEVRLEPANFFLRLGPGETAEISCRICPGERGKYDLPGLDILAQSPWGLWRQSKLAFCPDQVRILPNFRELHRFTLLAAGAQLGRMGIKQMAKQGDGQEFQELRQYYPGDSLRQIDWKATARKQQLIAREYQDERDQHIVLVLDCSRRMRHVEAGGSQFDQALNSALLLAHVAARQGDSVGLLACAEQYTWYPPAKKANAARSLLLASTQLFAQTVAIDYHQLAGELATRLKRRSLVVLLTNTRAEEHDTLAVLVRQLRSRHVLVIADLVEDEIHAALERPIHSPQDAWRYQALLAHMAERRRFALKLTRLGCHALNLRAKELPAQLVNTYLDIKHRKKL